VLQVTAQPAGVRGESTEPAAKSAAETMREKVASEWRIMCLTHNLLTDLPRII
jgi:hypothetical protein